MRNDKSFLKKLAAFDGNKYLLQAFADESDDETKIELKKDMIF
jgi:hypothetical protein